MTIVRNVEFTTAVYNYLPQIIPVLIVAPLYMRGEVEFGVVTQSAMAFSQVFNAFSLIAAKFEDLSNYAAVIGRVGSLDEAIAASTEPSHQPIEVSETGAPIAYDRLTLRAPQEGRPLVENLSLEIPRGRGVLLTGPKGIGKTALMLATAGLWSEGSGRISRPHHRKTLFMPERPYMVPGTLRDQFIQEVPEAVFSNERILGVLQKLHLDTLVKRMGGLDVEQNWESILSLGEQQLIAFARLFLANPDFAFLDHAGSALDELQCAEVYQMLAKMGISYMSVGDCRSSLVGSHDAILELKPDGTWSVAPARAA